jgi:hypothetical protein
MDRNTLLFPLPPGTTQTGTTQTGITVHDWLAAVAMQALLTKGIEVQADRAMTAEQKDDLIAARAYQLADAMLRARPKAQQTTAPLPATRSAASPRTSAAPYLQAPPPRSSAQ